MTTSHVDLPPDEVNITDNDTAGLVEEIQRVIGLMTNSLINAYRSERSKDDARRARARIIQASRLLYT